MAPRKRTVKRTVKRRTMRRSQPRQGDGVMDFLKKANKFLRKTKAISRVSGLAGDLGVPYASRVSKVSRRAGYGRGPRGRKTRASAGGCKF